MLRKKIIKLIPLLILSFLLITFSYQKYQKIKYIPNKNRPNYVVVVYREPQEIDFSREIGDTIPYEKLIDYKWYAGNLTLLKREYDEKHNEFISTFHGNLFRKKK